MDKRVTLTVEIFDPDKKAARAAQKVVLEEIYLVDAKTWRDPVVISPEVLTLQHKCSTEIILPMKMIRKKTPSISLYPLQISELSPLTNKSPNKPVMKIEATFYTSFTLDHDDPDVPDLDSELDLEDGYSAFDLFLYDQSYFYCLALLAGIRSEHEHPYGLSRSDGAHAGNCAEKIPKRGAKNQLVKKESTRRKEAQCVNSSSST